MTVVRGDSDSIEALFGTGTTERRTPRRRREKDIQAAILEFLHKLPHVYAWKAGAASFRAVHHGRERFVKVGQPGVSDIVGWVTWTSRREQDPLSRIPLGPLVAQFLAIEVKQPGKKPDARQARFLERVRESGGIAVVATNVDDVRRALGL